MGSGTAVSTVRWLSHSVGSWESALQWREAGGGRSTSQHSSQDSDQLAPEGVTGQAPQSSGDWCGQSLLSPRPPQAQLVESEPFYMLSNKSTFTAERCHSFGHKKRSAPSLIVEMNFSRAFGLPCRVHRTASSHMVPPGQQPPAPTTHSPAAACRRHHSLPQLHKAVGDGGREHCCSGSSRV